MKGWQDYEIRICKSQIRNHSGESFTKVCEFISNVLSRDKSAVSRFLKMNDELVEFRRLYDVLTWNEKLEKRLMEEADTYDSIILSIVLVSFVEYIFDEEKRRKKE